MRDFFTVLIRATGEALGVETPEIEDDAVSFVIDDYLLLIAYLPQAEQVLLSTVVAEPVPERRAEVYRALLQGQYFFQRTQGATLSVDEENRFVALQRVDSLRALEAKTWPGVVERFMQIADFWRDECRRIAESAEPVPALANGAINPLFLKA